MATKEQNISDNIGWYTKGIKLSREYLNNRWCVRCKKQNPTPYLRNNIHLLSGGQKIKTLSVVDIGCGNGRNSRFLKNQGSKYVYSLDMANDYGDKIILGKEEFSIQPNSIDIVLANYVFMFLNKKERQQVIAQIKKIAKKGCKIIIELYPAKDSFAKDEESALKMQKEIFEQLKWEKLRYSKMKFIAEKKE